MKLWLISLSLVLALAACSRSATQPEASTEAANVPAAQDDPFIDLDAEEVAQMNGASSSSTTGAASESTPSSEDSFLATPVEPEQSAASAPPETPKDLAQPTPPEYVPPPPEPAESTEKKAEASEPLPAPESPAPAASAPMVAATPESEKDLYDEYKGYKERNKARAKEDDFYETRRLFPHEGGAFQVAVDYSRNAFANYDFDPTAAVSRFDTQGIAISFLYFPVRSLSIGRLGFGVQGGAYWSDLEFGTGVDQVSHTKHAMDSYGVRATYEFDYFLGQLVVPHIFYGYDRVMVRKVNNPDFGVAYPKNKFDSQAYGGGLHLNLNRLEATAASRALVSTGIKKFYLSYTAQQRTDDSSLSHFLGLRFEM